jgi:hypothetical protein
MLVVILQLALQRRHGLARILALIDVEQHLPLGLEPGRDGGQRVEPAADRILLQLRADLFDVQIDAGFLGVLPDLRVRLDLQCLLGVDLALIVAQFGLAGRGALGIDALLHDGAGGELVRLVGRLVELGVQPVHLSLVAVHLLARRGVVGGGEGFIQLGQELTLMDDVAHVHGDRLHDAHVDRRDHGFGHHGDDLACAAGDAVHAHGAADEEDRQEHGADDCNHVVGERQRAAGDHGLAGREIFQHLAGHVVLVAAEPAQEAARAASPGRGGGFLAGARRAGRRRGGDGHAAYSPCVSAAATVAPAIWRFCWFHSVR